MVALLILIGFVFFWATGFVFGFWFYYQNLKSRLESGLEPFIGDADEVSWRTRRAAGRYGDFEDE